jgi:hypothetical protein
MLLFRTYTLSSPIDTVHIAFSIILSSDIKAGYNGKTTRFFVGDHDPVQRQLVKFERGGNLIRDKSGKKFYSFEPRHPYPKVLRALLEKAHTVHIRE